jgi:SAM-dependent methyltransferase
MKQIPIVNPTTSAKLTFSKTAYTNSAGDSFPILDGVARFAPIDNYSNSFGMQWNKFDKTQLDREEDSLTYSKDRFFAETRWKQEDLVGKNILEVGSGAGRFSKVVLQHTKANLYSVDYSDAVTANFKNNGDIAPDRLKIFQASVYDMPFLNNSFDKVFCLGVLQHTPDFEKSVKSLIDKAMAGAEIVVDFYPIKGWWTKINAKYMLRPLTKQLSHESLLRLIENNIDWLIKTQFFFHKIGLGVLVRFLPVCGIKNVFPSSLTQAEVREWAVLDTFDMFSPEHDHPQRVEAVKKMFEENGATVTFSGFETYGEGNKAAVIRATKKLG